MRSTRAPWAVLAAVMAVVLAAAVHYVLRLNNLWVTPDEVTYIRNAMAIGDELRPVLPGDYWWNSYAQLAPLVAAPFYLALSAPAAADAAHIAYAAVFVSGAVPVALVVRRACGSAWAGAVAGGLTIAVPWLVMAGAVLTEPVAYGAFCWALWLLHRGLVRGGVRGDVEAGAALVLLFLARTQFATLAVAFLGALVLHHARMGDGLRATIRAHALVVAAVALGALVMLVAGADTLLGNYGVTEGAEVLRGGTAGAARDFVAAVALGVGLLPLPLALAWVLQTLAGPADREASALAALLLALGAGVTVTAAIYVKNFAGGVMDRYVAYLAPLLVAGAVLALWSVRPALWALAAGAVLSIPLLASPYLDEVGLTMVSPAQMWRQVVEGRLGGLGSGGVDVATFAPIAAVLATAAVALALRFVRPPVVRIATVAVLAVLAAAQTGYALKKFGDVQAGADPAFIAARGWLDEAVDRDAEVTSLTGTVFEEAVTPTVWWELTAFNRQVWRQYRLPGEPFYEQNSRVLVVGDDGALGTGGWPPTPYVVRPDGDARVGFAGQRDVARDKGLVLQRVAVPWRTRWLLEGGDAQGRVKVDEERPLRIFPDGRSGRRTVTLRFTSSLKAPRGYDLEIDGRVRTNVGLNLQKDVRVRVDRLPATIRIGVSDPLPGKTPDPEAGLRLFDVTIR